MCLLLSETVNDGHMHYYVWLPELFFVTGICFIFILTWGLTSVQRLGVQLTDQQGICVHFIYTIHRRKIVWFWSKQNVLNCKACCVTACVSSLGWMQTFRCAKRYCLWEKSHFSILHLVFSVHTEMLTFSNMLPPCSAIYSVSSR